MRISQRLIRLLLQHGKGFFPCRGANVVFYTPLQNANTFQRYADIGIQSVLAAPRGAVKPNPVSAEFQKGFIIVDHHSPIAKDLPPETGVGGFSGATVGGEKIPCSVYGDGTAVEK